ncbi:MAG: sulfatase-like hydrolase/transferase [Planctomycetota bacterium]
MSKQPNILVFFTDQQRPDSIGCYGQPLETTPHLDRLARQGLRLTRPFTPNPVYGPARASLQTGRYPTATGNHTNNIHLPENADTVAKHLSAAGYATGYLGKWHLASTGKEGPDCYRTSAVPPERRGGSGPDLHVCGAAASAEEA